MLISIIVAMDLENGIGMKDDMPPWNIPEDLRRFRNLTMGHHVIVGRVTWDIINNPLKGRKIIVITRNPGDYKLKFQPALITDSLGEAVKFAEKAGEEELFIAGGSEIYQQTIGIADKMYITKILKTFECEKFFPKINFNEWKDSKPEETRFSETMDFYYRYLVRVQTPR